MIRTIAFIVSLGLSTGACVSRPAPGTRPSDMTAQAHVQECRKHAKIAQAQDQRATYAKSVWGHVGASNTGESERDIARQHEQAAKTVDPNAPDCP